MCARSLVMLPLLFPWKPQWNGRPIWCTVFPLIRRGRMRRVTIARASISPRGVLMTIHPPCLIFRSDASSGLSSERESWLQGIEPGHPARHGSADMVLGQPVGCHHDGVMFVAYCRETVVGTVAEVLCCRVTLLVIQRIMYR